MRVTYGEPLGPHPLLLRALERRLPQAAFENPAEVGVVLAAAGSSDPEANATIARLAAQWQARTGWFAVRPAYASPAAAGGQASRAAAGGQASRAAAGGQASRAAAGGQASRAAAGGQGSRAAAGGQGSRAAAGGQGSTGATDLATDPATAVTRLREAGARRVVVASYLLAPGSFADRIRDASLAAGALAVSPALLAWPPAAAGLAWPPAAAGLAWPPAAAGGAASEVADVVLDRYTEAGTRERAAA
jgi:sirohydrochlorin ferrochelatase